MKTYIDSTIREQLRDTLLLKGVAAFPEYMPDITRTYNLGLKETINSGMGNFALSLWDKYDPGRANICAVIPGQIGIDKALEIMEAEKAKLQRLGFKFSTVSRERFTF